MTGKDGNPGKGGKARQGGQALVETVVLVSLVALGILLAAAAFDKAVSARTDTLVEFIALPLP